MKKILLLMLIIVAGQCYAQTTRRITAGMNLQTEIDNATNGDIFIVENGDYGDLLISKLVSLIGTGYFLGSNTQATPLNARLGRVNFRVGSSGSFITGFEISGNLDISTSTISVTRNNVINVIRVGINEAGNAWGAIANNIIIKQNLAAKLLILGQNGASITGFLCKNNLFKQGFHFAGNISGEVTNNTFDRDIVGDEIGIYQFYTSQIQTTGTDGFDGSGICGKVNIVFKNNIMTNISNWAYACPITSYPTDIFINNILHGINYTIPNNLGSSNKTITTNDLAVLYVGYPNNPNSLFFDARNQLANNSPAKGAGENGTDCGAFGGDEPYVLSGIPSIPTIYQLTVPANVPQNGTLNVQIKAKTNN